MQDEHRLCSGSCRESEAGVHLTPDQRYGKQAYTTGRLEAVFLCNVSVYKGGYCLWGWIVFSIWLFFIYPSVSPTRHQTTLLRSNPSQTVRTGSWCDVVVICLQREESRGEFASSRSVRNVLIAVELSPCSVSESWSGNVKVGEEKLE